MIAPKTFGHGLNYAQTFLVLITLLLALSARVQAQCLVSTPSPETPPANNTKNNNGAKNSKPPESGNTPEKPAPSPTPFTLSIADVKVPGGGAAGLGDTIVVTVKCLKEELFIYSVWTSLTMPQFSDTLLALMGISAGTYVGFKIPERQTDPSDVTDVDTPAGINPLDNIDADADTDPQSEEEGC